MRNQRERFEAYFRLPGPKDPVREKIILAAADAYDAAAASGNMTEEHLRTIVQAVSHPSTRIWESCCSLLAAASERWQIAAEAIITMLRERRAHIRFSAICSLGEKTPAAVIDKVLKAGLVDRSARVRWKAADMACSLDQRQLIPDVAAAVSRERNASAKDTIDFALHFLRDGFLVRRQDNGSYWVSVRLSRGGTGTEISEREFAEKGIEAIVDEIRRSHGA
jgi:hypothetical protein